MLCQESYAVDTTFFLPLFWEILFEQNLKLELFWKITRKAAKLMIGCGDTIAQRIVHKVSTLKLLFDFDFIDDTLILSRQRLAEGHTTCSQVYWERSRSGVTTKHDHRFG
jgi:hypothetical protein